MTQSNVQLNLVCQKLVDTLIPGNLDEAELDRRILDVEASLSILQQMLKLPSPARMHKVKTLRSIIQDAFGMRGEAMTLG